MSRHRLYRKLNIVPLAVVTLLVVRPPAAGADPLTMLGADVSSVQRTLDLGGMYFDAAGTARDPLDILKSIGVNYIRLRAWNNPASGYNNKAKILAYAKIVKAKGLRLLIDFHYSDTWADPGKQFKPAAWASHGISQLQTDVFNYTLDVCNSLKAQGTTPDSVQIGNEINVGMLWNDGKVINNNFTNLVLPRQPVEAVRGRLIDGHRRDDVWPSCRTMAFRMARRSGRSAAASEAVERPSSDGRRARSAAPRRTPRACARW